MPMPAHYDAATIVNYTVTSAYSSHPVPGFLLTKLNAVTNSIKGMAWLCECICDH